MSHTERCHSDPPGCSWEVEFLVFVSFFVKKKNKITIQGKCKRVKIQMKLKLKDVRIKTEIIRGFRVAEVLPIR